MGTKLALQEMPELEEHQAGLTQRVLQLWCHWDGSHDPTAPNSSTLGGILQGLAARRCGRGADRWEKLGGLAAEG